MTVAHPHANPAGPGAPTEAQGLAEFMQAHHKHCDELFARAEDAARAGDREGLRAAFAAFETQMERHFRMEEEGFFPEFDRRTGMHGGGPTAVMRDEHAQMRGLLRQLAAAAEGGDTEDYLAIADTLLILMEQHNEKEEHMLYPMADEAFAGDVEQVLERLAKL